MFLLLLQEIYCLFRVLFQIFSFQRQHRNSVASQSLWNSFHYVDYEYIFLLVKIWLFLVLARSVSYKYGRLWHSFLWCFMKTSPLLFIYIIFLTITLVQNMENLNINGDNSADSSLPKLTKVELLDSCGGQQANPFVYS